MTEIRSRPVAKFVAAFLVGFVFGIAPFLVFITSIFRIAPIAKRTLAMDPFIPRETQRDEETG